MYRTGAPRAITEEGDTKDDLQLPTYPDGFGQEIKNQFDDGKTLVRSMICSSTSVLGFRFFVHSSFGRLSSLVSASATAMIYASTGDHS